MAELMQNTTQCFSNYCAVRSFPLRKGQVHRTRHFPWKRCLMKSRLSMSAENGPLKILEQVASGKLSPDDAMNELNSISGKTSGELQLGDYACLDTSRERRTGFPEVVWGPGKTPEQISAIMAALAKHQDVAMATRISQHVYEQVKSHLPEVRYHQVGRILTYSEGETGATSRKLPGQLALLSAGTSDLAVAEEARITAEVMGCAVSQITDVGVAGLHRLLSRLDVIREADVIIVVAGMDGALPSVVAGLVDAPVIAVPTSVGYGAAFHGVAPLLSALNACAPGVVVVNIDNGFGGAMAAARILRACGQKLT